MYNLNWICSNGHVFRAAKQYGTNAYFRRCPRCKETATQKMQIPKSQRPRRTPRG